MVNPKKIFIAFFGLSVTVFSLFPQPLYASLNNYYDYGPYYQTPQVLGFSLSIQENLPAFKLPDNLQLPSGSGILPDSPFYTFEKAAETAQLAFTFDPVRKEQLRLEFATERLSEAKTLMDQGKTGAASRTLDDYGKTFESVSENVADLAKRGNPQSQNLMEKAEETASAQVVVATALSLTSSPAQAEAWTEAANAGRQTLDKIAEAQGEPAIPPDLSEGIQTLKEQGLISEEESNKLYGLKTRSEVRDEFNKLTSSGTLPPSEVIKLDEEIAKRYPEIQKQQLTNLQVVELRSYQALPQPSAEVVENLQKWQEDPGVPPSNDIKPYLWYNRAQNLARDVNLSNFSQTQQTEVAKLYPTAVTENPTYSPPPSPSPTPSPSPSVTPAEGTTGAPTGDQTATPSASDTPSPAPSSTPVPAQPYLEDAGGALPGQPTYILKQFGENLSLTFAFDPAEKARLKMEYAERRLAEAEKLGSDPKNAALYESTLTAYQQTIADASNRVKELKESKMAKKMAEKLEAQAGRHEVVFEKGLLPPPAKNPKLISEVIKATEDAMDRSADALDRPALPPMLASRLNDLKAQGLIMPEEVDDLVRSASREEARGKIRKLIELKTFPLADAKKLDEAQALVSPSDYNQLVEVRKVEELQNLRSVQTDLAQTPTLRASAGNLQQKEAALVANFEPSVIKPEDLAGRADLNKVYQALTATASARPINSGQFGSEATPGAQPVITPPSPRDAVLSTCPEGATFKQSEGCVWADTGKNINDYDQYKCDGPRQYYSFAARKCVAYDSTRGWNNGDAQPICPLGYTWNWQTQSCQTSRGDIIPWPSPSPEPEPKDDKEIEERSKTCPEGSSYKAPRGCVWNADDKSVYDSNQYRCSGRGQYYSFEEHKCVTSPKEGEPYPKDASPTCKEAGTYWSWSEGKCVVAAEPMIVEAKAVTIDKPSFATPGSFLYPLKQWGETVRLAVAFSPEAKQQVRIDQARERLTEGYSALEKGNKEDFAQALTSYTAKMQELYNDLSKNSFSAGAKKAIGENLVKEAAEQNLILQRLEALAPQDQASVLSAASSVVVLGVDKAADVSGEAPIPADLKAKIESLPEKMISEENKKELLEADSRVEARLKLGDLVAQGGLNKTDIAFLNEDFDSVDAGAKLKVEELKKLEEIATTVDQKQKLEETVEKNESIVRNLQEFEKTFEPGQEVAAEIRPYVRLTRINEIAQTIRPDVVRLEDFQNRKDLSLAVATLQEEFRPTKEAIKQIEDFRRRNPGASLPPDLARVEALSFSLGVRQGAGPCYLPTPPFPANTPCPAPGAAIPISSYYSPYSGPATSSYTTPSVDKDGKPLIYGQGPKVVSSGVCTDGYHWMYDSGGWCMSNGGNYSYSYSSSPTGTGSGYTPYSPYYTAPGAPPATSAYPVGDVSLNDGCPYGYDSDGRGNCIRNSYPSSQYSYTAPSYYGSAPTYYTTTPPAGTVPGSGPKPTAPGQCPSGFHWMSDSGGWCMSDGPTYVPGGAPASPYASGTTTSDTPPAGGYNCGGQPYDPVTKRCKDGACPGGFNWDGSKCVAGGNYSGGNYPGTSYYGSSPTNCGSGYYWNGYSCQPSSGTGSSCTYPSGGCPGVGAWYDYSSCSCRTSSSYTSTSQSGSSYQYGCTPGYYWDGSKCVAGSYESSGWSDTAARSGSYCQPPSSGCGSNYYWDYGSCSCRSSSNSYSGGSYSGSSGSSCSPPAGGCGSGWWDTGSCSCRQSSSQGCYNVSASSCPSGWYFDSAVCTCRQSTTSSGGSTTTSSGGSTSTSSGSCPSGYHWMSDNGGWCMSDGGSSGSSTSPSSTPAPSTSTPPPSSEPAPAPPASSEPAPAAPPPPSEPAPAPASSEPAPAPSP